MRNGLPEGAADDHDVVSQQRDRCVVDCNDFLEQAVRDVVTRYQNRMVVARMVVEFQVQDHAGVGDNGHGSGLNHAHIHADSYAVSENVSVHKGPRLLQHSRSLCFQ